MLGQILTEITQTDKQASPLIFQLTKQNQQIDSQLKQIQLEVNRLPYGKLIQYVSSHQPSFNLNAKTNKIQRIFTIVQEFYAIYSKSQSQSKRCEFLQEQIKKILQLVQHYDLFGTLQLRNYPSSEMNLRYLKELNEIITQQILQYQNKQNINKFQTENEEVCQQFNNVIEFHIKFKELIMFIYQDSIKRNYCLKQNSLLIKLQYFEAIWTQQIYYSQQFLKDLKKFYSQFISYNINDRQYALALYSIKKSQEEIQISKISQIIFDSNEVAIHYNALINNFQIFHNYFNEIINLVPSQKQNLVSTLKKSILFNIKSYIEYLLPYLTMDYRRKVLSYLSINDETQGNIYELLVSLRMCGKDADMLVKTIKQITQKAIQDENCLSIIIKFIELAKQNKKNYQMNFFICNQLVQQFQQTKVTTQIGQAIKKILIIREQMRMKIHSQ